MICPANATDAQAILAGQANVQDHAVDLAARGHDAVQVPAIARSRHLKPVFGHVAGDHPTNVGIVLDHRDP
jgi:hypothetical protein